MWGFFVASIFLVTSQMNCDVLIRDEPFAALPFPRDPVRTDPKGRTGSDAT